MGILALNRLMMGQLPQTEIPSGDADGVLRAVDFLPRKYSKGVSSAPNPAYRSGSHAQIAAVCLG